MSSIRRFLIVVLLAAIVLINFIAAGYGYRSSVAEAEQLFDERLADIARVLAATPPGYYRTATPNSAIAFQIWQDDALEAASGNIPDGPIAAFRSGFSDVKVGGFNWRAFALELPQNNRWVIVAESADIRSALADNIVLDSVRPIIIGLPIYALLIWLVVGRGLRPLELLARQMRIKRSHDLSPIDGLETPAELQVLVNSINELLSRLDAAFERERAFAADAAHELRTPISVLKLQLHNLMRDTTESNPRLAALQQAIERMERSVEQVLMLSKMAPDQFAVRFEELDLTSLAREIVADLYPQLEARQQQIELVGEPAGIVGDTSALRILLSNLIENASRYSGDGGQIKMTVACLETETVLTVEDSGPGIPAELRERVFERFYRGQHDYDSAGSGIGLAIVKNIVDIHGADISLGESGFESGLSVRIVFRNTLAPAG